MQVNFKIKDVYAIEGLGHFIELSGVFDFLGFDYEVKNDFLTLHWKKNEHYHGDLNEIFLIHKEIHYLKVTGKDPTKFREDDSSLGNLTWFSSDERETNDEFMLQESPNEKDDILYVFWGSQTIRINCTEIELQVK